MSEKRKGAIPIAVAKKVSQEHGCPIVLIFAIEADGCHYTITTYGQTKPLCAWAAKLSSDIQQAVMAGKVLGDVEHAHNPYELIATLTRERDEAKAEVEKLAKVRTLLQEKLRTTEVNIPAGYRPLAAYTNGAEVIVTGSPPDEDDDPKYELHNCDAMGCGWEHVLLRQDVEWPWLAADGGDN